MSRDPFVEIVDRETAETEAHKIDTNISQLGSQSTYLKDEQQKVNVGRTILDSILIDTRQINAEK